MNPLSSPLLTDPYEIAPSLRTLAAEVDAVTEGRAA
jgi:hypothetical protein